MVLSLFQNKVNPDNVAKVEQVAKILGINPNWLFAVMYFETGGTLSTTKTNSIGSVGLIQFTRDKSGVQYKTINGKRYLLSDIKNMSFNKQMDLVLEYFKEVKRIHKKSLTSFEDVYLAVFFPLGIGKPDNYILQTNGLKASLIAKQNPIFDRNKDGQITKLEVTTYFAKYYGSLFTEIKKKV